VFTQELKNFTLKTFLNFTQVKMDSDSSGRFHTPHKTPTCLRIAGEESTKPIFSCNIVQSSLPSPEDLCVLATRSLYVSRDRSSRGGRWTSGRRHSHLEARSRKFFPEKFATQRVKRVSDGKKFRAQKKTCLARRSGGGGAEFCWLWRAVVKLS
jgi:hypothetical protein